MARLTIKMLQRLIGAVPDGIFGPKSKAELSAMFSNKNARPLTDFDFEQVAQRWNVPASHIKGVRKVEAPRGAYDEQGRPSILFERHKFRANCEPAGCFDARRPDLSGGPYGPGGYGPFSAQWGKLADACALDPAAAFAACSWGAFQVMGENAEPLGYLDAYEMAHSLVASEAAHLETFVRFVEHSQLVDKFRNCKPGLPDTCVPFVAGYNGKGFRQFNYHVKLAAAI